MSLLSAEARCRPNEQYNRLGMKNWKARKHTAGTSSFWLNGPPVAIQTFRCELTALLTPIVCVCLVWLLLHLQTHSLSPPPNSNTSWGVWAEVRTQHVAGRAQHPAKRDQWWKVGPWYNVFCEYYHHISHLPHMMFTWTKSPESADPHCISL